MAIAGQNASDCSRILGERRVFESPASIPEKPGTERLLTMAEISLQLGNLAPERVERVCFC
jgi:hypothetical protein